MVWEVWTPADPDRSRWFQGRRPLLAIFGSAACMYLFVLGMHRVSPLVNNRYIPCI